MQKKKTYFREFNLLAMKFDNKHILKTVGIYELTIEDIRIAIRSTKFNMAIIIIKK